jgi:hypothetical protein
MHYMCLLCTKRRYLESLQIILPFLLWLVGNELCGQVTTVQSDTTHVKSGSTTKILLPGAASADVMFPTTNGTLVLEHEITVYPVGVITHTLSSLPLPDGFHRADGQALSRTTYERLFKKIGTTYGSGDGATTFNLPVVIPPYVSRVGLRGWWPMAANADDRWFHNNDATVTGAALATDRYERESDAFDFDGVDDELYIANTFVNLAWEEWTISVWTNMDGLQNGTLLNTSPHVGVLLSATEDGVFKLAVGDGVNWLSGEWLTNGGYQAGVWRHICIVRSGLAIRVYLDSVLDQEFTLGGAPPEVNCSLYVGRCDCDDESINGKLDDIGVWSRALTTTEITELFQSLQEAAIKCK